MKSLLEVVKANKGLIIKRTLISVGLAVGVTILGGLLLQNNEENEDYEDCVNDEEVVSEVSEPEEV